LGIRSWSFAPRRLQRIDLRRPSHTGQNDSGLFETNLRDDCFLPLVGAGAEGTWKLDLPKPKDYPTFDYATISDVILHVRYTSRQGVEPNKVGAALGSLLKDANPEFQAELAFSAPMTKFFRENGPLPIR